MHFVLIGLLIIAASAYSQKLPNYIVPCVRTKPDFNKCAYEHALEAIPHMLNGDRRFQVPSLTPLKIPKVSLQPNNNLKITLNDLVVYGIDKFELKDIKFDFDKKNIRVLLYGDILTVTAQYEIDGRLLVPLRGSGPCNITIVNEDIEYNLDFDVEQKNGQDYMVVKKDDLKLDAKKAYYNLENLFGNKQLSDETNRILNENDREVGRELNGPITETIKTIVTTLIKNYLTRVPMDNIFLKE